MSGEVIADERPTARKAHRCDLCDRAIEPGESYRRCWIIGDDGPYTFKECAHCSACVTLSTVTETAHYYGEGYSSDDFANWEPGTVWEARLRAQWRRKWRRRDGALFPVPTRESVSS